MTGINGEEAAIAKNLKAMEDYALPIFEKGHLAVVGEWLAWPVIRQAGGESHSSQQFSDYQYPAYRATLLYFFVMEIKFHKSRSSKSMW